MRFLRRFGRQHGRYLLDRKTTLILILVVVGGYLASKYGSPIIDHFELEKAMEKTVQTVRRGSNDRKILESLVRRLKVAGLDTFQIDDFVFERSHGRITISIEYEVFVDLGFGHGHTLGFSARASGFGK